MAGILFAKTQDLIQSRALFGIAKINFQSVYKKQCMQSTTTTTHQVEIAIVDGKGCLGCDLDPQDNSGAPSDGRCNTCTCENPFE